MKTVCEHYAPFIESNDILTLHCLKSNGETFYIDNSLTLRNFIQYQDSHNLDIVIITVHQLGLLFNDKHTITIKNENIQHECTCVLTEDPHYIYKQKNKMVSNIKKILDISTRVILYSLIHTEVGKKIEIIQQKKDDFMITIGVSIDNTCCYHNKLSIKNTKQTINCCHDCDFSTKIPIGYKKIITTNDITNSHIASIKNIFCQIENITANNNIRAIGIFETLKDDIHIDYILVNQPNIYTGFTNTIVIMTYFDIVKYAQWKKPHLSYIYLLKSYAYNKYYKDR